MELLNSASLFGLGVLAGGMIAVQSVLNAVLGQRVGSFGTVLVLTVISFVFLVAVIVVIPGTARFEFLPRLSEWHLYLGSVMGVLIMAALVFLVPRIGTTYTLVATILGQLVVALIVDHLGLLSSPQIPATMPRILGVALVVAGAILVGR